MTLRNLQPVKKLLQCSGRGRMLPVRQALIGEVRAVDDLGLVIGVVEAIGVGQQGSNAAHEVAVRVARLPVVRIVDADDGADIPFEVRAGCGAIHGGNGKNEDRSTARRRLSGIAGWAEMDAA